MKTILLIALLTLLPVSAWAQEFIHPMEYDRDGGQLHIVRENIAARAEYDCAKGAKMCEDLPLNGVKQSNLYAFRYLTGLSTEKDRALLDRIIQDKCSPEVDQCNYVTLMVTFKELNTPEYRYSD